MDARDLSDLMVFLEVARAQSITRAAQRLGMVQSNVTARVKKLEQAADARLLRRHARGVKTTPAGEAAVALAQRVEAVLDDLRFTFGERATARAAQLKLGAIETVLASHLAGTVTSFARAHAQVDVSVCTGSSTALLTQLAEGELDGVFVSRVPEQRGLRHRLAYRDDLVVAAPAGTGAEPPPWRVEGPPLSVLVQRLGCSYTERLLEHLAKHSARPYRLLELGTLEGILSFVEAGMGIAAMPRAFVRAAAAKRKLRLHALPKPTSELRIHLVIAAKPEASFAAEAFFAWGKSKAEPPRRRASIRSPSS